MSICIWRGMKSAGEHPVGGEKVSVLCPELVEKEAARRSAVVYYIYVLGITSLFHSQNVELYHNEQSADSSSFFKPYIFRIYIKACFYNPNLQLLYIEVKPLVLQRSQRFPGPAAV